MSEYSEKLRPSPGLYVIAALAIPFFTLTLAPFNVIAGVATGVFVFVVVIVALNVSAPRIIVTPRTFRAGKAVIDRRFIGAVSVYGGESARAERGVNLDARAWTLFRGFVDPVVKIAVLDESDPTPYWLVSTRNPQELAATLRTPDRPGFKS